MKHILTCSFGKDSIATALLALQHGEPLDVDNDTSGWPILLLIVIGVPMIIAGIVCGVLYSQMKTARLKTEANDYIGAGLKLRVQVDNYTHTDRVQVYDPPHEESSSSGGSSASQAAW